MGNKHDIYGGVVLPELLLRRKIKKYKRVVEEKWFSLCLKDIIVKRQGEDFVYDNGVDTYTLSEWFFIPMTLKEVDYLHHVVRYFIPKQAFVIKEGGVACFGSNFKMDKHGYVTHDGLYCFSSLERAYMELDKQTKKKWKWLDGWSYL